MDRGTPMFSATTHNPAEAPSGGPRSMVIASGPAADRAMAIWRSSRRLRVVDCQDEVTSPARRRVDAIMDPEVNRPACFRVGQGVWVMEKGGAWSRGCIVGVDTLAHRYQTAWVDVPHKQAMVPYHKLRPRFAGEAAPGVAMDGRIDP